MAVLGVASLAIAACSSGAGGGSASVSRESSVGVGSMSAVGSATESDGSSGSTSAAAGAEVTILDGWTEHADHSVSGTYKIAVNDGLQYAPISLVQDNKVLEKMFPEANIEYVSLNSTPQIRDSLLSGQIIAGTCSQPPYLQGWSAGVQWAFLSKTTETKAVLYTHAGGPSSVADLVGKGKIAGGPGTAYDYAMQSALKAAGSPPDALKTSLTQLSHGDAWAAFRGNQVVADFAPAQFGLEHEEAHDQAILDTRTAFHGAELSTGICAMKSSAQDHPKFVKGYYDALQGAIAWMNAHKSQSDKILSDSTDGKVSTADVAKLTSQGWLKWTSADLDLKDMGAVMFDIGAIEKKPEAPTDVYIYPDNVSGKW